jgi:hypothetical protein
MEQFRNELGEIKVDVKEIKTTVNNIEKILAAQHVTLEDHSRRSTASETRIDAIEKKVYLMDAIMKVGVGVGGAVMGAVKLFESFKR